ncbi:signal peptidase II [Pygmaiobacter massiliensis]|uniref:signal peptidase II n=1 Tax=Pygmaiobacter massiliensis TaxID=1917873 RepID=UPI00289A6A52|nr:signal peptidase II [Pygmaiobacter massiliensis]
MLFISILAIAAMVAADQIAKMLATQYLAPVGTIPFIPGVMELRYVLNEGMAFSMLSGARWFLIIATSAALLALLWFVFFRRNKLKTLEYVSLLLIIGGGIGNLIDRVLYGYVVDFFATTFVNFAVFNVADCFVCIGVGLLMVAVIFEEYQNYKKKKAEGPTDAA